MYRKVLLAYDGSIEGRRALQEGATRRLRPWFWLCWKGDDRSPRMAGRATSRRVCTTPKDADPAGLLYPWYAGRLTTKRYRGFFTLLLGAANERVISYIRCYGTSKSALHSRGDMPARRNSTNIFGASIQGSAYAAITQLRPSCFAR
jgi:hypothetical protein